MKDLVLKDKSGRQLLIMANFLDLKDRNAMSKVKLKAHIKIRYTYARIKEALDYLNLEETKK